MGVLFENLNPRISQPPIYKSVHRLVKHFGKIGSAVSADIPQILPKPLKNAGFSIWPHNREVENTPDSSLEAGLTVAAVARLIGVAPDTLRTWDRRYGMGPSQHVPGKHRRYSSEDVGRLQIMRRLVMDGVMPAEAARVALATAVADLPKASRPSLSIVRTPDSVPDSGSNQSANVISLSSPKSKRAGLSRTAAMMDSTACQRTIAESLEEHGVLWTWDNLLVPVLVAFGERWARTGEGVEIEHMLSEVIMTEFQNRALSVDKPVNARPVVLAAAPHELHTLPLYAIGAALAEHQITSRILGSRMPADALASACRKLGPSAVVVWSQSVGTADLGVWRAIEPQRPVPLKVAVGPGWGTDLPGDVTTTPSLAETLIALAQASGH